MPISATLYREQRFATVNGRRMAFLDEGVGDAIVFQHGNPTSSPWRDIMPHCEGLGRLIACDLIGMGRSDKLPDSGPERYSYQEQRDYLFALWDQLNLGNKVIMAPHDWGVPLRLRLEAPARGCSDSRRKLRDYRVPAALGYPSLSPVMLRLLRS